MGGHARQRIGFQQIQTARLVFQKINPPPTPAADGIECADSQIAHQAFVFLAQIRRAEINRIIAVVLGLFVVKLHGRNNPHAGQGAAVQYAASVFAAADKGFGNDLTTKLLQFAVHLFQTACFFYFHHADTAALICRLDEHRQSELPFYGIEIAVVVQHGIIRHG